MGRRKWARSIRNDSWRWDGVAEAFCVGREEMVAPGEVSPSSCPPQWKYDYTWKPGYQSGPLAPAIFERSKEVLIVALPASQRNSTFFSLGARTGSPEADFFAK